MTTRWTAVVASCATFATGIWVISPRFSIGGPSLVDDSTALSRSPHQVSSVARLFAVYAGRFRPGWIVWNYVQWHTFAAPAHMLGPNCWGVVRFVIFAVGVSLLSFLFLRSRLEHTSRTLVCAVATIVPLLVLTTPKVAVDFARFGPQEPLLVGCLALGASLLILGWRVLTASSPRRRRRRAFVYLAAGSALWIVGVYQKEIAVVVVALGPFLFLEYRRRIRDARRELDRGGQIAIAVLSAVVLLPIVHVAIEVARITERGPLVYGAQVNSGDGVARKTVHFIEKMPENTGSYIGWLLLAAITAQVATSVVRRRPDWLLSGLLVTALASLAWSAQTGQPASRFYIPCLTLTAIGFSLILVRLHAQAHAVVIAAVAALVGFSMAQFRIWSARPGPELSHVTILAVTIAAAGVAAALARRGRSPQGLAVAAVFVLICGSAWMAHPSVGRWARDDERGWQLVTAVSRARDSGCPVVAAGLDPERATGLPVLLALRPASNAGPPCAGHAYLVLGPGAGRTIAIACRTGSGRTTSDWILQGEPIRLIRCRASETREAARLYAHALR